MEAGLLDAPMFSASGDELLAARDFVTGFGLPAAVVCAVRVGSNIPARAARFGHIWDHLGKNACGM